MTRISVLTDRLPRLGLTQSFASCWARISTNVVGRGMQSTINTLAPSMLTRSPVIHGNRLLSSQAVKENQPTLLTRWTNKGANQELPEKFSKNAIITDKAGRRYAVVDLLKPLKHKLKPKLVRRRILQLRTYEGKERDIRHSPWRLQLICRHVAGLPYEEAMTQLAFLNKVKAPLVKKVLKRTASTAFDRDGLQPSQLEVAECFATHGTHLKRVRIMGRGRQGIMHHRFSHMRVVLREIDFVLKIFSAKTMGEKRRWIERQMRAQEDYDKAKAERDELERLERLAALKQKEKEEKNKK